MIQFKLNNRNLQYAGDKDLSLLHYLRLIEGITSVKDGCSGQAACGACLVEINGKPKLSCVTLLSSLGNAHVTTLEGIPELVKLAIGKAFVEKGAVQCGFCSPGFIMRTKILFQENPEPSRIEIKKALNLNICRCTGYVKIIDAIELALKTLKENHQIEYSEKTGRIGTSYPKYQAYQTATGQRHFVKDMKFEGMFFAALKFSDHPRAKVLRIDSSEATKLKGVIRVFTSADIPGDPVVGLIYKDWPLMVAIGGTTSYIGDVIAGVVADSEKTARLAATLIKVEYEVYAPVTDIHEAVKGNSVSVHAGRSNILEECIIKRGEEIDQVFAGSAYISEGIYQTQRVEHAFLETEAAIAMPIENDRLQVYTQGQGIYEDRRQIASILNLPEEQIAVTLVPNGGGFGGKEDMTVQGHVALFAYILKRPVLLSLTREESIIMHPKRHPVFMEIKLGCDKNGKINALKLRAMGDSGAYASVGTKVMERVAGHATGAYFVPNVDIVSKTIYTNNIPSGAMRGFGANQVAFALESCIDDLCEKGGFDRWQFRWDNALINGLPTATGQVLKAGVGVRECLLAVKAGFYKSKYTGIACGIKNCGVGNGMPDFSDVIIDIVSSEKVVIHHGWTEMGQGVHNMAIQTLCQETGIAPGIIEVKVESDAGIRTGMTTSSRATSLLCNAIIVASKELKKDLETINLFALSGKSYRGRWICDWTTKPGADVEEIVTHYSYGYAAQLVVLDDNGNISKVIAAHDAGKVMNPKLFEGQIEGAVVMGIGYALYEDLEMEGGHLKSKKLKDCQLLRAKDIPDIKVIGVEVEDPYGPYGAKGVGEIGLVPTAAAVANALYQYEKVRYYQLPMKRKAVK
jgi:aldehyde oxidoreductase